MKTRALTGGALLVFVLAAVGVLIVKESRHQQALEEAQANPLEVAAAAQAVDAPANLTATAQAAPPKRVTELYYFHSNYRCGTCMKFERYTVALIERDFAAELASGALVWLPRNTELPEHNHFVQDFQLPGKALVVADAGDRKRFEILEGIWEEVASQDRFERYVGGKLRAFMQRP